jgi:hypothetical protein
MRNILQLQNHRGNLIMRYKQFALIGVTLLMVFLSAHLLSSNNVIAVNENSAPKKGETIESMPDSPIEKPEPKYKPNRGLSKDRVFDVEKNLNRAVVSQRGGSIEKTELMTYGDFARQQSRSPDDYSEVSPDRLIWVVKTHYPKGYEHPKVGLIQNARVISIYDAETGELFGTSYEGKGPSARSLNRNVEPNK